MILLAHPGISDDEKVTYPPWGVLDIATSLRMAGHEVEVVDLSGPGPETRLRDLCESLQPGVVGLTGKLGEGARRLRDCVDGIDEMSLKVAVGGPLVSSYADPADPLWRGADALFSGDGGVGFVEWIEAGAPRLSQVAAGGSAPLDEVAMSAWWPSLERYVFAGIQVDGGQVGTLHVSGARGCTRRCTFCYLTKHLEGRVFRTIGSDVLLRRCEDLAERTGAVGFYFVDDCLIDPYTGEGDAWLSRLGAAKHEFYFGTDLQLHEMADPALLERLYAAGFRSLYVGVESATPRIRKLLGKGRTPSDIGGAIKGATALGFEVVAALGVGWPTETPGEMAATLSLAEGIPEARIDAFRYTPLPGVPLTSFWAKASGVEPDASDIDPFGDYSTGSRSWAVPGTSDPVIAAFTALNRMAADSRRR